MRFEKALRAVKVIKDQIQHRSQSLLNLARGYFSTQYMDFVEIFNNKLDLSAIHISRFSGC